ncbi:MAG: transposase [Gammaproteobacteria bacterium]|nr:transposase [Gammaproteobacteria bacterium]
MSRKHYPEEYREQIVKLARAGRSIASLAREFEPTEPTIRNWLAAANGTVPPAEVELRPCCTGNRSNANLSFTLTADLIRPMVGTPNGRSRIQ